MPSSRFGTAINCIDGRVQAPVAKWLMARYGLDYVDTITLPGPDKAMAEGAAEVVNEIRDRVGISVQAHGSNVVALAGHHDCATNAATEDEHRKQIVQGLQTIRFWNFAVTVVGLWVNADWQVEVVAG